MDNKEQARVKANDKILELTWSDGSTGGVGEKEDHFVVFSKTGSGFRFPFTDLKDGDLCLVYCQNIDISFSAFYYNGRYYRDYENGAYEAPIGTEYVTSITKTGFNILEHLEGK